VEGGDLLFRLELALRNRVARSEKEAKRIVVQQFLLVARAKLTSAASVP
jgi:hypothetical protein